MNKDIHKHVRLLLIKEPLYGLFLISLIKKTSPIIDTACVAINGLNTELIINNDYWESLDNKSKLGLLKHELLHIVFFHLLNMDQYNDKTLYNVACDLEVNQYISDDYKGDKWEGIEIDEGLFKAMNLKLKAGARYYYDKLSEQCDKDSNFKRFINGLRPGHSLWVNTKELTNKELIKRQIKGKLIECSKGIATTPLELTELVKEEYTPTVVDWKSILRLFGSSSHITYTKKTRYKSSNRFKDSPGLRVMKEKKVLVAIDTSGSISNNDFKDFFNELIHIDKLGVKITILEADVVIHNEYKFRKDKMPEFKGRGGTNFDDVMNYCNKNSNQYTNLIYFTDGVAPPPTVNIRQHILWAHTNNQSLNEDLPGMKINIK